MVGGGTGTVEEKVVELDKAMAGWWVGTGTVEEMVVELDKEMAGWGTS
jgi:hypothetical protein